MRIISLETFRPAFQPNLCVIRLRTDDGLVGLGDVFFQAPAVEAYLHSSVAPILFAIEHPTPESVALALRPYVGYQGGGVEVRGNGGVDLALWDLLGRRAGLPVHDMLGGAVRDRIRVYNTCAGPQYVGSSSTQSSTNWGISGRGEYEDLWAAINEPEVLARELLDRGVTGMKVWPFDEAAEASHGVELSPASLAAGLSVFERIRDEVGETMDLMVELHGLWKPRPAVRIIRELERFDPYWIEDAVRPDSFVAMQTVRESTDATIASGETLTGRGGFTRLLAEGLIDVATVDVQWSGGLTEARKVAALADLHGVAIAPHDCTGPVTFAACVALSMTQPNALIQETTRSFLHTWYPQVVTGVPEVVDGGLALPTGIGLGVQLTDGFESRADVVARVSQR